MKTETEIRQFLGDLKARLVEAEELIDNSPNKQLSTEDAELIQSVLLAKTYSSIDGAIQALQFILGEENND